MDTASPPAATVNHLRVNTVLLLSRATDNNLNLNKVKVNMAHLRDITVNPNPVNLVSLVSPADKANTALNLRAARHMVHLLEYLLDPDSLNSRATVNSLRASMVNNPDKGNMDSSQDKGSTVNNLDRVNMVNSLVKGNTDSNPVKDSTANSPDKVNTDNNQDRDKVNTVNSPLHPVEEA